MSTAQAREIIDQIQNKKQLFAVSWLFCRVLGGILKLLSGPCMHTTEYLDV